MPNVTRPAVEQQALLEVEELLVEVRGDRQLRARRREMGLGSDIGHPRTSHMKTKKSGKINR
jgi:hypothetical protein